MKYFVFGQKNERSEWPYNKKYRIFYVKLIIWIVDDCHAIKRTNGKILITKKQETISRLCLFNKTVLKQGPVGWGNNYKDEILIIFSTRRKNRF